MINRITSQVLTVSIIQTATASPMLGMVLVVSLDLIPKRDGEELLRLDGAIAATELRRRNGDEDPMVRGRCAMHAAYVGLPLIRWYEAC